MTSDQAYQFACKRGRSSAITFEEVVVFPVEDTCGPSVA